MALAGYATEIRVRNDSKIDFENVVVGGKKYGDIKRGAATDYQTWERAYRYSLVSLLADSKPLKIQPEDYVGETQLGNGHFTYVLTIQNGRLDIRADEDKVFAIVYYKAPEGGRQIVHKEVGEIQREHGTLGNVRMEDLTISEPHRWYSVGLTDLASGHLLSAATSRSWRYILMHGTNSVGVATVFDADAKTGNAQRFGALYDTGLGKETLKALQAAEKLPQIRKQDYELRFLDVMPVYFFAVWLHGKSDDIIIPLPPTYGRWNAYQPYSESQMMKLLKPEAKKVLKQPNLLR